MIRRFYTYEVLVGTQVAGSGVVEVRSLRPEPRIAYRTAIAKCEGTQNASPINFRRIR